MTFTPMGLRASRLLNLRTLSYRNGCFRDQRVAVNGTVRLKDSDGESSCEMSAKFCLRKAGGRAVPRLISHFVILCRSLDGCVILRQFLGSFLFTALAAPAGATTRYVSQNGGSFSGSAASNGQAAISVSTFNSTTNSPGDINNLCGQITTPLSPQGNGASGSVVTIKFDMGVNITVSSCGSNGCIYLGRMSYYLIDGGTTCGYANGADVGPCNGYIQATGNGTGSGNATSTGIWARSGASNIEIRNLGFTTCTCTRATPSMIHNRIITIAFGFKAQISTFTT